MRRPGRRGRGRPTAGRTARPTAPCRPGRVQPPFQVASGPGRTAGTGSGGRGLSHVPDRQPARSRPAYHHRYPVAVRAGDLQYPAGRRACPQLRGYDEEYLVGVGEGEQRAVVELPWHVHDHQFAMAAAVGEDGGERVQSDPGRRGPVVGERGEAGLAGQRRDGLGCPGHDLRPACARPVLPAEYQVKATADGSASISRVSTPARAAVRASPAASTLAPAPPRPPTTDTTRPRLRVTPAASVGRTTTPDCVSSPSQSGQVRSVEPGATGGGGSASAGATR